MRVPILDINRKELSDPRRFTGFENGITLALLARVAVFQPNGQRTLRDIAETLLQSRA